MKTESRVAQMGLDVHRKFSQVTGRDVQGKIVMRQRLEHADREELRKRLRSWPSGTPVILESTFGWGWLSDELAAAGLEPHLANSRKVAAWRDARGLAKSDRIDADLLSELWDQKDMWWEVWLAPPEVRSQREWLRYRMNLVAMQTATKNRIHAVLHRHGIVNEHADLFGTKGRRFLSLLLVSKDARVGVSGKAMLKGYLQLLDQLRRQIARVTREIRRQLVQTAEAHRLVTLPGIGQILAYTILAEIGRIDRFASARDLASYSLLAPRSHDSAPKDDEEPKGRRIGRIGRRTLKWAWIEAAHGAVLSSARFRAIFDRITNGGKKNRNRGYVAVAHELCRVARGILKTGTEYREDRPERPGERSRKADSRSGTGQPDHPLVAVVS